jgi:nucleotide-binding universal stress UspA family protein
MLRVVHAVAGTEAMWTRESDASMFEFLFNAARTRLAELQTEAGTACDIALLPGNVASAVNCAALEAHSDLIVIGRGVANRALGRLRSIAYSIIREAPCPVITI